METYDNKLLIRIAEMYYIENLNQSQISKKLNIHRTTISRLLKKTRDEGIVKISINYDTAENYNLENELQKKFGLKKSIITSISNDLSTHQQEKLLARGLDEYLATILFDKMTIGLSWGSTLASILPELSNYNLEDILCVPMIGGPSGKLKSDYHVNTITYEMAKKVNGESLLIDSPAFPETLKLKKALMENEFNQTILELWRNLDLAIMGIGSPKLQHDEVWQQFYGNDVFEYLEKNKVAGDVVSRFFDYQGIHIPNQLDDKIIGIDISDLKRVPYKIGIASSVDKTQAILAAIKGNYINVLVTTEEIARILLAN